MHLQAGILLLVHGEVTSPEVDMFDREAVFIETVLEPLLAQVPGLRVVLEHITTEQAVNFVASAPDNVAATVTPQHMLYNRNALFQVGCRGCNLDLQDVQQQLQQYRDAACMRQGGPAASLAMPCRRLHIWQGGLCSQKWLCLDTACMAACSLTSPALTLLACGSLQPH